VLGAAQVGEDGEYAPVVAVGGGRSSLRKMLWMCESTVSG
jgi:hypothetical protein